MKFFPINLIFLFVAVSLLLVLPTQGADYVRPGPITAEGKAPGLKFHLLSEENGQKSYVLAFHRGDEVMAGLTEFARQQHMTTAHFTAIGSFYKPTLAWYDVARKAFKTIPVDSEVEVASLIGNITADQNNSPLVHIHCVVADSNGKTTGGHLLEGPVGVTLEVFLTAEPTTVHKVTDEELGVKLID
jgi:predicted DNA-binding protein with PD1-like motif